MPPPPHQAMPGAAPLGAAAPFGNPNPPAVPTLPGALTSGGLGPPVPIAPYPTAAVGTGFQGGIGTPGAAPPATVPDGRISVAFATAFMLGAGPNSAVADFKANPAIAFGALGGLTTRTKLEKWAGLDLLAGPDDASSVQAMSMCFDSLIVKLAGRWPLPTSCPASWPEAVERLMSFGFAAQGVSGSHAAVDRGVGKTQRLDTLKLPADAGKAQIATDRACIASVVEPLCNPAVHAHESAVAHSGASAGLTEPAEALRLVQAHGMPALAYHYGAGPDLHGRIATHTLPDGKQAIATIPFSFTQSHGGMRVWVGTIVNGRHGAGRLEHGTIGPPLVASIAQFAQDFMEGKISILQSVKLLGGEEASARALVDAEAGMQQGTGRYGAATADDVTFMPDLRKALPVLEQLLSVAFGIIAGGTLENGAFALTCRSSTSPESSEGFLGELMCLGLARRVQALEYFCTVVQRQIRAIKHGKRALPPDLVQAIAETRELVERNLMPLARTEMLQQSSSQNNASLIEAAVQKALPGIIAKQTQQGAGKPGSRWGAPVTPTAPVPAVAAPAVAPVAPATPKGPSQSQTKAQGALLAAQQAAACIAAGLSAAPPAGTAQPAAAQYSTPGMPKGISPNPKGLSPEGQAAVTLVRSATGDWKQVALPADKLQSINDCAATYNAIALWALGVDKDGVHPPQAVCPFKALLGDCNGIKQHGAPPGSANLACPKCANKPMWQAGKLKPIVAIVKAATVPTLRGSLKGDG